MHGRSTSRSAGAVVGHANRNSTDPTQPSRCAATCTPRGDRAVRRARRPCTPTLAVGISRVDHDEEFEQFFLDNYAAVLHILALTTGDRERATDAAQEAFIKAYSKWSKIRRYDSPVAWVRRVAINASHDSFRKDRRRRRREQATPLASDAPQSDRYASDEAATQLLRELPDRQREVATLFYVDDRSVVEIAAILGLNEGTVKSHLSSARDHLRRIVERDGAER